MKYLKAILILIILYIATQTDCQPGSLALEFGNNGILEIDESYLEGFNDFAQLSDGSIIAVGYVKEFDTGSFSYIMRISSTGEKIWGRAIDLSNGGFTSRNEGVVVRNDEIFVMGNFWNLSTQGSISIIKYKINGDIDLTFGSNGNAIATFDQAIYGAELLIDDEGSLYVPGATQDQLKGLVIKFRSNGVLDKTFGNDGFSFYSSNSPNTAFQDGMLVGQNFFAGGWYGDVQSSETFQNGLIVKLDANGIQDPSFGNNGSLEIVADENVRITSLSRHGNNHFLILTNNDNVDNGTSLYRSNLNGDLYSSFGTNGSINYNLGENEKAVHILADETSGFYIIASIGLSGSKDFTAIHINSSGSKDLGFGNDGQVVLDFNFDYFLNGGMVLQNGNLLLGGFISDGFSTNSVVVVLNGTEGCSEIISKVEISECGSVEFEGTTYSESGDYEVTIMTMDGCDSLVQLHLDIKAPSSENITLNACEKISINNKIYSSSGVYIQELINNSGCDSILTIDLTIEVLASEISVVENILTGNATGTAYQWINCTSNSILAGETEQSYIASESGEFAIIAYSETCIDTSDCVSVVITSSESLIEIEDVVIYPNPTSSGVTIQNLRNEDVKEIFAYNSIGQKIDTNYKKESRLIYFYTSDLEQGVLYIQVIFENGISLVKPILKIR